MEAGLYLFPRTVFNGRGRLRPGFMDVFQLPEARSQPENANDGQEGHGASQDDRGHQADQLGG